MIAIGIAVMIAFIVILIISARRQKAGLDPIVPSTFPNPFFAGVAAPRPQTTNPDQSIDQGTATNPGIVVKPLDPLLQLTTFPITNYALLQNPDGTTFVRTNAKDVGYIYDVIGTQNPKLVQQTTTLIQDIGDIGFGSGGEVYARYYDDQNYRYEAFFGMLEDSLSRVVCTTQFPIKPKLGDSGQSIEKLQFYLSQYLKQTPIVAPGVFDAATRQMVIDFQKSQKLTADGSLGAKSITALESICTQSEKKARAQQMVESNTPRYVLSGRPQVGEVHNMAINAAGTKLFYIKTTIEGIRGYVRSLDPVGTDKEILSITVCRME